MTTIIHKLCDIFYKFHMEFILIFNKKLKNKNRINTGISAIMRFLLWHITLILIETF